MIDVVCVLFTNHVEKLPDFSSGVYDAGWVDNLYKGIKRNTTKKFNLICLVDEYYQFFQKVEPVLLLETKNGWGNIMEVFRSDIGENRRLVLGLDTIITGNIDHILDYDGECGLLTDPYHTSTICNGVGIFSHEQCKAFWKEWSENLKEWKQKALYGGRLSEMEFLRQTVGKTADRLDKIFPNEIQSYKVHYKNSSEEIRNQAKIVYFHGRPKMQELPIDAPILKHWC